MPGGRPCSTTLFAISVTAVSKIRGFPTRRGGGCGRPNEGARHSADALGFARWGVGAAAGAASLWGPRARPRARPRSSGEEHFSPKEGVGSSNLPGGTHETRCEQRVFVVPAAGQQVTSGQELPHLWHARGT